MHKLKIGIIKETKVPEDNRVVLTPQQVVLLKKRYPNIDFYIESSEVRAFHDEEYIKRGLAVVKDMSHCDILFGVKEVEINSLIPDKHYFFFGHIAKMQPYNKPLIKKMMELGITFTDYEYLVDENNVRLCAFGWWAGVVGVYNTLRAYGIRYKMFHLPKPDRSFTLDLMLSEVKKHIIPPIKIVVTGKGRVSQGAQYFLDQISVKKVNPEDYLSLQNTDKAVYTVLNLPELVHHKDLNDYFDRNDFKSNPSAYESNFGKYAEKTDVFIPCHFWGANDPIYLSPEDMKDNNIRIKVIGDVTCDINGSVGSTIRPSTHSNPFYDYNPVTGKEEEAFSSNNNITVMAVDTLPNALAIDTSQYFGEMLIKYIFDDIVNNDISKSKIIERATILKNGELTPKYCYLQDYAR